MFESRVLIIKNKTGNPTKRRDRYKRKGSTSTQSTLDAPFAPSNIVNDMPMDLELFTTPHSTNERYDEPHKPTGFQEL